MAVKFSSKMRQVIDHLAIRDENILYLNVMRQHFDRIRSCEKVVEFRDYTDFYTKKLCEVRRGEVVGDKPITHVLFQAGMKGDGKAPRMLVEMKGYRAKEAHVSAETDLGRFIVKEAEKEGFSDADEYIGIALGRVVCEENV